MNSPTSSSAVPAEKSLSSDGAETGNLMEKRISKPATHSEMQTMMRTTLLVLALVPWGIESVLAQPYPPPPNGPPPASSPPPASNPPSQSGQYSSNEVIDAGHRFFGTISRGLAEIVEK